MIDQNALPNEYYDFIVEYVTAACEMCKGELNDSITRSRLTGHLHRQINGDDRKYLIGNTLEIQIICDETNNTPEIIDSNGIVVDVVIKNVILKTVFNVNIRVLD